MKPDNTKPKIPATAWILLGPILVLLLYLIIGLNYAVDKRGQTGDFLGGVASPVFGFLSALLVYLSFQQQIRANRIQIEALENEISARKDESKRNSFRSNLILLRSEVKDLTYLSPIDDQRTYHGMQAFEIFIDCLNRVGPHEALKRNENVADTLLGVTIQIKKELIDIQGVSEELKNELAYEMFVFYSLKISKGLNSIQKVSGNPTIDRLMESRAEIDELFRQYGYKV